jgi:D-alanine-D-alanine ligase
MHVVVLAGGLSPERDVSIRSGRRVANALRAADSSIDVIERDVDSNLLKSLRTDAPDCVIPMLHGAAGEDGAVRDVLDGLGIPYVGSGPDACRLAFDKPVAKALLRAAGIATPRAVALPHSTFRELGAASVLDALVSAVGLPAVVKPARGGSALGTTIVNDASELPAAMVNAFAYGDVAMIESFVAGVEVAVAVVDTADGPRALPAVEIVPDSGFYDYAARYTAGSTEFFVPARVSQEHSEALANLAVRVHTSLGLRDWSRTDAIVTPEGAMFLEVNAAPGLTETSLMPQALTNAGMDLGELTAHLVRAAVARG